jgi:plastocyanin
MTTGAPPLATPGAPGAPVARGAARPVPAAGPPRRATRGGGLLVALLALGVGVGVLAPLTVLTIRRTAIAEQANPAVTLQLSAQGMRFTPAEIRVPRGAVIRVDFTDDDPGSAHDFQTVGQLADTRVVAWPRESHTTYFKAAAQPGRYLFICSLRGHAEAGMTGTIVVE